MPITYRQHQDTRDGRIYNCVLMPDGKWWSVTGLAWDGIAWIPPRNDGYWDVALDSARLYLRSDVLGSGLPEGTHLPSRAEWMAMATAAGALTNAAPLKSVDGWNPSYSGDNGTDNYGFALIGASGRGSFGGWLTQTGYGVYLHASDGAIFTYGATGLDQSTSINNSWLSVRFIVDAFNEPHPIKLFGVNFDGFERGMTVSIHRPIQVVDSIGGSVKLIPYGPAELDEWRVETELWVKGEWAAELEAAVPPYGVPQTTDMYLPPRSGSASFPGLRPALQGSNADKYIYPQVTRFESQGRKGPIVDLFGYFMDFTLRAWADGQATNQASTPTTTLPTWLAQKFAARQIQDWSVQTATVSSGGFRSTYMRSKHGRRKDVNFNLDHLTAAQANELVAFFRGVRHNVTTITCDNGPDGLQAVSVYLVGLRLHRTGLHWDGTLETALA